MIKTEIYASEASDSTLVKTYSNVGKKLFQEETGIIYGSEVIDVFKVNDVDGYPISRYTYIETEEYDVDS